MGITALNLLSRLSPVHWLVRVEPRRLAWGGAMATLVLLLGAAVAAAVLWNDMVREAEVEVERTVRLLAEHAARVFEPVDHTLVEVVAALQSHGFGQASMDSKLLHEIVRPYATLGPYMSRLFVLDREGRLLGLSDQARVPESVRYDEAWFRELDSANAVPLLIGAPQFSRLGRQQIVPVARAVVDAQSGQFVGAAAAALDLKELTAFHTNLRLQAGWRLAVMREDGTPIAGGGAAAPARTVANDVITELLPRAGELERVQWRPERDRESLVAARRVLPWPLVAVVSVDTSTVVESWQRRTMWMASFTLPAALGLLGISGLASAAARRSRNLASTLDLTDARYKALIESSPDGIVVSRNGRIEYVNAALLRVARCDAAFKLAGQRVDALLDGNGPPHAGIEFDGPPPSRSARAEHWLRACDGTLVEVETLIASAGADGDSSLQIVVRDISARKRVERRLRESEERYRLMVEGTPECSFLLLDANGVIEDVSRARGDTVSGVARDVVGRPFGTLFAPEDAAADEPVRLLRRVASGGAPVEREGWCRSADGSRFWANIVLSQLGDESGKGCGYHAMVRDIGSRKALQDELDERRRQLEALALATEAAREREKVRIARELHDELGQMLTVQKLDLELLESELDGGASTARQRLMVMRSHVDAALEMTRRIAGDLRPLVLDDLGLVEALRWLLAQARSRGSLEGRLAVRGDPTDLCAELATALFRIAQEGVTNILRHANATQVEITLKVGDDGVELCVADNGKGVARSAGPRRGLGLLGVEERARLLGGTATIGARTAGGTEITVRLPVIRRVDAERTEFAGK